MSISFAPSFNIYKEDKWYPNNFSVPQYFGLMFVTALMHCELTLILAIFFGILFIDSKVSIQIILMTLASASVFLYFHQQFGVHKIEYEWLLPTMI